MRLTRARVFVAAGLLALAGTATGTILAAGPVAAAPSQVVLVNPCTGVGQVRPAVYDIGCMSSSEFVTGLSWTSWRSVAFGHGTLKVNDCTPSCAQGKYIKYPILTVLWRARAWPMHSGREYFSRLTWIYTSKRPAHERSAQTFTLPPSGP
jgi:hypothetical protein